MNFASPTETHPSMYGTLVRLHVHVARETDSDGLVTVLVDLGLPPDAGGNGNYAFSDAANYAAHTNDWGTTGICHRKSGIKGSIIRAKHQAGDPNQTCSSVR